MKNPQEVEVLAHDDPAGTMQAIHGRSESMQLERAKLLKIFVGSIAMALRAVVQEDLRKARMEFDIAADALQKIEEWRKETGQ